MLGGNDANEYDGGEKLKPFLFFKNHKYNRNLLEKFIDFPYNLVSTLYVV